MLEAVTKIHGETTIYGMMAIAIFCIAYILVIFEERIHLAKSKPIVIAASIMWILTAMLAKQQGVLELIKPQIEHGLLEYAELFLFLLVAMTYVNVLTERNVFKALNSWLMLKKFSLKQIFFLTGLLAFFISPIADNLTTALVMSAVVIAVGANNKNFIILGCINIVVAANAGGAFTPFGDITTLMIWQKGVVEFSEFFRLFIPALVNYSIPAIAMSFAIKNTDTNITKPNVVEVYKTKSGAYLLIFLFLLTIITTVLLEHIFHIPPAFGMMTGLGYLMLFTHCINKINNNKEQHVDLFQQIANIEWDTLLFFYGILASVSALATLGYLSSASELLFNKSHFGLDNNHSIMLANSFIGLLSALIDNIPVTFAVLTMEPNMSHGNWLLLTLAVGTGGSLLSIGSAAGVALMGQAKGYYTFFAHLRYTIWITLGYIASIVVHIYVNQKFF